MKRQMIGYPEALQITLDSISPVEVESIALAACTDRVIARDLYALVDSPSVDASLKDGYALRSREVASAAPDNPVSLQVVSMAAAGVPTPRTVIPGTAVRIQTGAKIPEGADAVLTEEFAIREDGIVKALNTAEPGRNILPRGSDVEAGELISSQGHPLSPGMIGILAAAGYGRLPVYRRLRVAIIATGDEVVAPGNPLPDGKLYASNMATLNAWCLRFGMKTSMTIVSDDPGVITDTLARVADTHDAVLTSGGAWSGDRDFVAKTLNTLGWQQRFHRIRMGPGKAVGFGLLQGKPVFLLPGGPPSNLLAFVKIALPGILKLGGYRRHSLPEVMVKLRTPVAGRHRDWEHLIFGKFINGAQYTYFEPLQLVSRLKSMALADGVISIPEGINHLPDGAVVPALVLT